MSKKIVILSVKEDRDTAIRIYNDLKNRGFDVWLESESLLPGQNRDILSLSEIEKSDYVLVMLSESSMNTRDKFHRYLKTAINKQAELPEQSIFLIPLKLGECEVRKELKELEYADFSNYKNGLKKLLKTINPIDNGIFFGREKIMKKIVDVNKNIFIAGGKEVGKTLLLKDIKKRVDGIAEVECNYHRGLLYDNISAFLAVAYNLPTTWSIDDIINHILREKNKKYLFLLDNMDDFIEKDAKINYNVIKRLYLLSEEERCFFVISGGWKLYANTVYGKSNIVKNFGETIKVDILEEKASKELMISLDKMNISNELKEIILRKTGKRPNLIKEVCDELLKLEKGIISDKDLEIIFSSETVKNAVWRSWQDDNDTQNMLKMTILHHSSSKGKIGVRDILELVRNMPDIDEETIMESFERLEMALVLKKSKMKYSHNIPILKDMFIEQGEEPVGPVGDVLSKL